MPSDVTTPLTSATVRSCDHELLECLRDAQSLTMDELKQSLGVTATAVRQRLERLLSAGLISRQKAIVGRGRPLFRYGLTVHGERRAGADAVTLAEAMWREIMALRDSPSRRRLLAGIARRLGGMYGADSAAHSLDQRMKSLSGILVRNQVHASVHWQDARPTPLPVLSISVCPYPTLREGQADRSLCQLEEQMYSEALGAPVTLTQCRLDGNHCCQFTPVQRSAS